jgi:hypothetical protein
VNCPDIKPPNLLPVVIAQQFKRDAAPRTRALPFRDIVDLLPGVQMRIVRRPMPTTPRPLPTPPTRTTPIRCVATSRISVTRTSPRDLIRLPCVPCSEERPNSIRDNTATCSDNSPARTSNSRTPSLRRCSARAAGLQCLRRRVRRFGEGILLRAVGAQSRELRAAVASWAALVRLWHESSFIVTGGT